MKPPKRHKRIILWAVATAVLLGGAATGVTLHTLREAAAKVVAQAMEYSQRIENTKADLAELLVVSQDALEDHKGKTADPDAYTALAEAVAEAESAMGLPAPEPEGRSSLRQARSQRDQAAEVLGRAEAAKHALEVAEIEEHNSNQAWQLLQAKADLEARIEAGEKTYADSEGQVDDETSRVKLRKALDAAIAVLDAPGVETASPTPSE
jgi:hypothetical protein